jgi:hypothetical protein
MVITERHRGKLTNGRIDSNDRWSRVVKVLSRWPSAVTCVELKEEINQCIRDNRRISTKETESEVNMLCIQPR